MEKKTALLFLHVAVSTQVLLFLGLTWPPGKESEGALLLSGVEVSPEQHGSPFRSPSNVSPAFISVCNTL